MDERCPLSKQETLEEEEEEGEEEKRRRSRRRRNSEIRICGKNSLHLIK